MDMNILKRMNVVDLLNNQIVCGNLSSSMEKMISKFKNNFHCGEEFEYFFIDVLNTDNYCENDNLMLELKTLKTNIISILEQNKKSKRANENFGLAIKPSSLYKTDVVLKHKNNSVSRMSLKTKFGKGTKIRYCYVCSQESKIINLLENIDNIENKIQYLNLIFNERHNENIEWIVVFTAPTNSSLCEFYLININSLKNYLLKNAVFENNGKILVDKEQVMCWYDNSIVMNLNNMKPFFQHIEVYSFNLPYLSKEMFSNQVQAIGKNANKTSSIAPTEIPEIEISFNEILNNSFTNKNVLTNCKFCIDISKPELNNDFIKEKVLTYYQDVVANMIELDKSLYANDFNVSNVIEALKLIKNNDIRIIVEICYKENKSIVVQHLVNHQRQKYKLFGFSISLKNEINSIRCLCHTKTINLINKVIVARKK